jgi:hypothetical protein
MRWHDVDIGQRSGLSHRLTQLNCTRVVSKVILSDRWSANESNGNDLSRNIRIRFSAEKPEHSFSAIRCCDNRFWIDDRDFKSKKGIRLPDGTVLAD